MFIESNKLVTFIKNISIPLVPWWALPKYLRVCCERDTSEHEGNTIRVGRWKSVLVKLIVLENIVPMTVSLILRNGQDHICFSFLAIDGESGFRALVWEDNFSLVLEKIVVVSSIDDETCDKDINQLTYLRGLAQTSLHMWEGPPGDSTIINKITRIQAPETARPSSPQRENL